MCSRLDSEYTKILGSLRWGNLTTQQIALLNSKVTTNLSTRQQHESQSPLFYRPIIVTTNRLPCAINCEMTYLTGKKLSKDIYECEAQLSNRPQEIFKHIQYLNDDLTDRVPMKLTFFIEMSVRKKSRNRSGRHRAIRFRRNQ